nr:DMSO/TMAO reductase YedYZ heme-binding membrane subunit [Mucilaginibacter sp. X4EP1]
MLFNNNQQKSPKRRFLLILGVTAFICFCALGLMIIFWDSMLPTVSKTQKVLYGAIIIVYAVIRFTRLLKKDNDEV